MAAYPDVLIIGGGIIGLTTAYFLAREGVRVEIVDKGDLGQEASWAGAGILPAGDPVRARSPLDQLRAHSAVIFPELSAELLEKTGIDNGYLRCGGLAFVDKESEAATDEWRNEEIPFELLEAKNVQRLEPAVAAGLAMAYHLPDMAQLRNPRHLKALLTACQARHVRLQPGCPVHGFETQGRSVLAAKSDRGPINARNY
ncbi:MAG TPA: FAD-dependent oxidoreductase, partial [Gemmataceae bacterium]|nr:FAD-dependent oxidoreductase [Gemmataceae bacterium]